MNRNSRKKFNWKPRTCIGSTRVSNKNIILVLTKRKKKLISFTS